MSDSGPISERRQFRRTTEAIGMPARLSDFSRHRDKDAVNGKRMVLWLQAIERDRNYARLLFGLPLIEPVSPEFRRWADGWIARNSRPARRDVP